MSDVLTREKVARTIYEAEIAYMLSVPRLGLKPFTWEELGDLDNGWDRYLAAAAAVLALLDELTSLREQVKEGLSLSQDHAPHIGSVTSGKSATGGNS